MAKRNARSGSRTPATAGRTGKRPQTGRRQQTARVAVRRKREGTRAAPAVRKTGARPKAAAAPTHRPKDAARRTATARPVRSKPPAYQRARRTLDETELAASSPSTLDMDRRGSAARSGHAGIVQHLRNHPESGPALTGGDVDASWEDAYHTGDEAPGGDNPTPDQDVVHEIGRSLGIEYEDAEELKGAPKIEERDRHRWELDPASSEDYRDRRRK
jgi:hypothetical protein